MLELLQPQLFTLWRSEELIDVELEASDGTVLPAHRIVLAAASGFFRALLCGAWRPQQPPSGGLPRWALGGIDGPSLQLLLHAIYSKLLPLTAEGAAEGIPRLLAASNFLEVLPVKEACCQWLRSQLSLGTVADTLALAAAHDCADLLADASRFFQGHFSQLLKSEGYAASLAVLPPDLLRDLLSGDELSLGSELEVARAMLLWAAADPRHRGALLPDLLPAARMPPAQLCEEAVRGGLLAGGGGAWMAAAQPETWVPAAAAVADPPQPATPQQQGQSDELAHAFFNACQQLQHMQAAAAAAVGMHDASAAAALTVYRPRLGCATGLMLAGGLDDGWRPLRTVELYDPQQDAWSCGPSMPAPASFAAAAMLGQCTYVVEGAAHAPHVLRFDRQQQRWDSCRGLAMPRVNMAVAALEGYLYVLGGRAGAGKGAAVLRDVEVFDPAAGEWRPAAPMAQPRTAHAAAACGGKLYAVGGQATRSCHATVECWEPGAGRWVELGCGMQQPRKYLGLASAEGRLVAVGGMTGARLRLHAAEALDPREGRWQPLPPAASARSSAGVAALHGCVYVVGGNVGAEVHENYAGVEAYVPAAGRWRECSPISHGRSGLSASPF